MWSSIKEKIQILLIVVVLPLLTFAILFQFNKIQRDPVQADVDLLSDYNSAADHGSYEILKQEFDRPQDVTAACLSCHTKRGEEIMQTAHWRWEREVDLPGKGTVTIGKKNLINNFCTGANGNNGSCMRCHIGYGWTDKSFDFHDQNNIDCLVCHDQTGTYFKQSGKAGLPATTETATSEFLPPDYQFVSANVGLPKRNNCGVCHFYGGGGNNVKHGDLEEALLNCSQEVDVHMGIDGMDMHCIDCHKTKNHQIPGKLYSVSSGNDNRISCEQCHTSKPHRNMIYDGHTAKIACQTCHIPTYAKANATKLWWDWSKSGKLKDGEAYSEYDFGGNKNYLSIKGSFIWDDNVVPEYYWFNGVANHYLNTDTISEIPVNINTLYGEYTDSLAKIWPVKVHRGKQVYDTETKQLVHLKLWAPNKGEGAYWLDFDYNKAAELGMEYNNRYYSGNYDFIRSDAYWPINHMVAPKEQTLTCTECHSRNGRLVNINDVYIPGKSYNAFIDGFGIVAIIMALLGTISHAIGRYVYSLKNNNKKNNYC